MTFTFSSTLPADYCEIPKIISGQQSNQYAGSEYLLVENGENLQVFQIKYKYQCSPFREATITGNLLVVGHEGHFYLYDLSSQRNILALQMDGYFGHFYIQGELLYVADSGTLSCLNKNGKILWRNTNLGVDGIIVKKFTDNEVYGSGEWDPPGGWVDFVLDIKTGKKIQENVG